ncbi:VWA domain-containing protein, partial [Desulfobulbus sp. AH-315-M07]|nr:VWA domain-containing protein [Desulfobulbus sp. AH-315-M07]
IAVAVRRGVLRRPVLFIALVLSFLPAAYVLATWLRWLEESYLRFMRPLAVVLPAVLVPFVVFRLLAHRDRHHWSRRVVSDLFIVTTLLAATLAVAGPEIGRPLDKMAVVVLVDRSRSIELVPGAERRIESELRLAEGDMRERDRIGTVVFAASAAIEHPLRLKTEEPASQKADLGRDASDIAAGVRRALAELPSDSAARIVLISDGVATRGDAMAAAAAAVASDVPIDVIVLEQEEVPDIRVVSLRAPPRVSEGETFELRLVIASPERTSVEIRIAHEGKLVAKQTLMIDKGEDVVRIPQTTRGSGLHRYDVEVTAVDDKLDYTADDNSASTFVRVRGSARALLIDGAGGTGFIASVLRSDAVGFMVDEGRMSAVPNEIDAMAAYDLIVMGDIAAKDLSPGQLAAFASYVRDLGGGLWLTGGRNSFGPGGYSKTPIEEIAPVTFDLKQEKRRASLAEVIGIDISGSMGASVGSHTKLQLANEAAARSASLLGAGDQLGVAHVDTAVKWTVPLQTVTDKKKIEAAIRSATPGGGGIYVDVTLKEAYAVLAAAPVNLKHVLLFADGADAENITPAVKQMVADAFAAKITTSCVSLGQGGDVPALEQLARLGGGRFYLVEDATRLPAIFAQETILASKSALSEEPFKVVQGMPSTVTAGINFAEAPKLEGYVITIPKPRSQVLLRAAEDDPLLAIWSSGLGRSAAFTSDLKLWGVPWTHWKGAARLVAQVARQLSRGNDDERVRLEAEASGGELRVRANVVDDDGRAQSFRRLRMHVSGPDGFTRDVPLEAAGAGLYTASLPLDRPGAYIAVARDEVTKKAVAMSGAALSPGEELRPTGSDITLLERLAQLTGGERRATLQGVFRDRPERRFSYDDITPWLAILAAVALLLAVAARRLSFPDVVPKWLGKLVRWRPFARSDEGIAAPGAATADATLGALLQSRQRGRPEPQSQEQQPALAPSMTAQPQAPSPQAPSMTAQPHYQRPPPSARRRPRRTAQAPSEAAPTSGRQLTAAEILLNRRRGRK